MTIEKIHRKEIKKKYRGQCWKEIYIYVSALMRDADVNLDRTIEDACRLGWIHLVLLLTLGFLTLRDINWCATIGNLILENGSMPWRCRWQYIAVIFGFDNFFFKLSGKIGLQIALKTCSLGNCHEQLVQACCCMDQTYGNRINFSKIQII